MSIIIVTPTVQTMPAVAEDAEIQRLVSYSIEAANVADDRDNGRVEGHVVRASLQSPLAGVQATDDMPP